MIHHTRFLLGSFALSAICFAAAGTSATAQVASPSPAPASTTEPAPATAEPIQTMAPGNSAPGTVKPPSADGGKPQIKKLKEGTLPYRQVAYGLSHPVQEAKKLHAMHTVKFENIRVVRLSKLNYRGLHAMNVDLLIADESFGEPFLVAQTTPNLPGFNGSNSPIQYLRDVLANINVSNALNNLNVLNNSTVNVAVSLSDVLNNNKIAIGQVVGVYVGGGGLINTIIK